jgi:hypothetical protein
MIVVIDNVPLRLLTNPNSKREDVFKCLQWYKALIRSRVVICLPEIIYYESRRQLLLNKMNGKDFGGLDRLEEFKNFKTTFYQPITTEIIVKATELWAISRKKNEATAHSEAIDADVILAATAITLASVGETTIVATDNINHIARYTPAKRWEEIKIKATVTR